MMSQIIFVALQALSYFVGAVGAGLAIWSRGKSRKPWLEWVEVSLVAMGFVFLVAVAVLNAISATQIARDVAKRGNQLGEIRAAVGKLEQAQAIQKTPPDAELARAIRNVSQAAGISSDCVAADHKHFSQAVCDELRSYQAILDKLAAEVGALGIRIEVASEEPTTIFAGGQSTPIVTLTAHWIGAASTKLGGLGPEQESGPAWSDAQIFVQRLQSEIGSAQH